VTKPEAIRLATLATGPVVFSLPLSVTTASAADTSSTASLLNYANQMNNEEEDMAGLLHSKAGDNQALMTLSDTLKGDHKANQAAVKSLADQKNVKLESYKKSTTEYDKLSNLSGSGFNSAFFTAAIKDHRQALREFERAKDGENDRDVTVYIDQTIPVLQAHLKMAENLRRDSAGGSSENPTNNRAENTKR
jgi:putative membrane protein